MVTYATIEVGLIDGTVLTYPNAHWTENKDLGRSYINDKRGAVTIAGDKVMYIDCTNYGS